jgi:hypothetical protein
MAVVAAVQAVIAVGFIFQVSFATALWPYPGVTPLSNIFIGSIYLAAAASTGWCLLVRSDRAMAGIAIDYLLILVPFLAFSVARVLDGAGMEIVLFSIACAIGIVFGAWLLRWSLSHPWRDPRPTPRLVRGSFAVFVVALIIVGGLMVFQVPNVIPWKITPDLSTLFGFMFLGAAGYFLFAFLDPRWENAGGQLAGFLAYDIVLIVPFLERLPTISDELRPNLWIYTAVVVYSGVLSFWYLAIDRRTRYGRTPPAAT